MDHWEIILEQARKHLDYKTLWSSLGEQVNYKLISVEPERLIIERHSGGKNAIIGKIGAIRSVKKLKEVGSLKRKNFITDAVRQTALVLFHPYINWDKKKKLIIWTESKSDLSNIIDNINEATDDELEKIFIAVNKRRSQNEFRKYLLNVYNNKCAISGVAITEVLEAAHIHDHSKSGINASTNGLLLRSDLHKLFDAGLLRIDPSSKKILLDERLKDSIYAEYENKDLATREDGKDIDSEFLRKKLERFT